MIDNNLTVDAMPDRADPGARVMVVDAEHFGVRFLLPVLIVILTLVSYFIFVAVFGAILPEGANPACAALPLGIVMLFGGGFVLERVLKRLFPSRRYAILSDDALMVHDERHNPPESTRVEWTKNVNVLAWRFDVKRRTRVPKGWYCMALRLLQDETEMILYTFMPPEEAEAVRGYRCFVRLRPRKETESNTDLRAVADQRRLLKLESARWYNGAELGSDDFHAVLSVLEQYVPDWV
jgi:hypothetical protein